MNAVLSRPTKYYLYGDLPVKMEVTPAGGLRVSVFDPATRTFHADSRYRSRVLYDRDNLTRELSAKKFGLQLNLLLNPKKPFVRIRRDALSRPSRRSAPMHDR